jgi:hypothetical protein
MRTQPTLFDSLLKMMKPSIPQSPGAPAEGMPSHPQVGIFGYRFTTAVDKKVRDDPGKGDGENIRGEMQLLAERLDRIEALLARLLQQRTVKEWYVIAEAAEILGKAEFTVREWCRLGRIQAQKRPCGCGRSREWMIAHAELVRIQNEGLLPQPTVSTRIR